MKKTIQINNLSKNQLAYAVGLAEAIRGVYTTDPLRAGFPEALTENARQSFINRHPELDTTPAPAFLQDREGIMYLWGPGEWQTNCCNDPKTGLPHIFHGSGGVFDPLATGVNILDREQIATSPGRRGPMDAQGVVHAPKGWTAWSIHDEDDEAEGDSLMDAGLRCYLKSVFGQTVLLPGNVE